MDCYFCWGTRTQSEHLLIIIAGDTTDDLENFELVDSGAYACGALFGACGG